MSANVVITDCDHADVDIELAVFAAAGVSCELAACRTADDVIAAGRGAVALLVQYAPVTRRVLEALPECRVVARYGVGLDTIDVEAAQERGVSVLSVPDYCVDEVSDHAFALVMSLSRGIVALDRSVHTGDWDYAAAGVLHRTRTRRLGVIGAGRTGQALAAKGAAVGFDVVLHDPYADAADGLRLVPFDELLATSDVVSLHLPLSEQTHHLIDASAIARMRRGACLVNVARGGLVDTDALVQALETGQLGGAGLDVLEHEPIPEDHPLLRLPSVIVTPHAAFYSQDSIDALSRGAAEAIVAALGRTPSLR
jgi:D-3-phosphoglycerate dehydrogenase / 2-oxoglutarate reductase